MPTAQYRPIRLAASAASHRPARLTPLSSTHRASHCYQLPPSPIPRCCRSAYSLRGSWRKTARSRSAIDTSIQQRAWLCATFHPAASECWSRASTLKEGRDQCHFFSFQLRYLPRSCFSRNISQVFFRCSIGRGEENPSRPALGKPALVGPDGNFRKSELCNGTKPW